MITSYQDALKYLYDNLPMFQRVGAQAIKKDLTNTLELCSLLGNPHLKFKTVHVGGTNGKGSTCHMLASVLQASGYKTGLYTSPHLKEFTERIKVNGAEVSHSYVLDFVKRLRPAIEEIRPSFFEITVAMAFDFFARSSVDVAVVEVGLGGRLDSTNVITPLVSVITNISLDHKELLGDTLPLIAGEKAGIIKPGIPVVISERQSAVEEVFVTTARRQNAPIFFASDEYSVHSRAGTDSLDILRGDEIILRGVNLPLKGLYQKRNVPGVMKTIEILLPHFPMTGDQIRRGLEDVIENTNLKGRWQQLGSNPTVVCDTGHNFSGVQEVVKQIFALKFNRLFMIWGMVKDKDVKQILSLLPANATYYFCQSRIPRALDADVLQQEAAAFGLQGQVIRDVNEAKRAALAKAGPDDLIFIGGSTYLVAEIDEL
ncbi:MAG TPA: folylpolyglutamate synthase/dihydrofolate synthase family protein [Chryseosolibacter sp.]|nr:folylpolyglutamate synthase/dihydrofolate synthase family protein [Chryseosolibacter sp.]